jgi:hypothetical protein
MFSRILDSFIRVGAIIVVLCGGFTACSSHDEFTPKRARAVTAQMSDLDHDQMTRVVDARDRVRFVGESHRAAMGVIYADALGRRASKRPSPKPGTEEYCRLLGKAAAAALRVINQARAEPPTQAEQARQLRAIPELADCRDGAPNLANAHLAFWQSSGAKVPEVTGAYEPYIGLMETRLLSSDWSVASVTATMNDVLATAVADGIPQGDLLALAAIADFSGASADEWQSPRWSSLIDQRTVCPDGTCLISRFTRAPFRRSVGKVVGADITGCLSSVKSWSALKILLAMAAWEALAGECGVRGAIGSGIAIIALM